MHFYYIFVVGGHKTCRNFASTDCTVRWKNAFEDLSLRPAQWDFRWPRVGAKWDPSAVRGRAPVLVRWSRSVRWLKETATLRYGKLLRVSIKHFTRFGLPKSIGELGSSPLDGTSESKPSCRVRKTWYGIEQREMISLGALSPAMRRWCIITSRSLSRQALSGENLEKQHRGKPRLVVMLGKYLRRFWDCSDILLVDFIHERRTINAGYYHQLLDEVKQAYWRKNRDVLIPSADLLHDNARPHTAALTREKLDKIHRKTLEHPPYSPNLSLCDYHMFGLNKKNWKVITLMTTIV